MFPWQVEIRQRIEEFASHFGVSLAQQIGFGYDGLVFETDSGTAIKGFKHEELYVNLRLHERDLFEVCGASIPHIFSNDDDLWCIEMEIVAPPFVLDFAGASLDAPLEFPDDVMVAWTVESRSSTARTGPGFRTSCGNWRGSVCTWPT